MVPNNDMELSYIKRPQTFSKTKKEMMMMVMIMMIFAMMTGHLCWAEPDNQVPAQHPVVGEHSFEGDLNLEPNDWNHHVEQLLVSRLLIPSSGFSD